MGLCVCLNLENVIEHIWETQLCRKAEKVIFFCCRSSIMQWLEHGLQSQAYWVCTLALPLINQGTLDKLLGKLLMSLDLNFFKCANEIIVPTS